MSSSPADTFAPFCVSFICATALAFAGLLGPDHFTSKVPSQALAGAAVNAKATGAMAAISLPLKWRPQPAAATPLTRIGFGSCIREKRPIPIWQTVMAAKPDTFLLMGDNVYGDFKEPTAAKLQAAYARLAAHPDFTKARAALPMLAIWDDHDFGKNDGGASFKYKAVAEKHFRAFWQGSGTLQGSRGPGVSYARMFGPEGRRTQIIMLDTRSFRSKIALRPKDAPGKGKYKPDPDPEKTLLGAEQWQWLAARLKEPADLRVIVSSIQVIADGHNFERWGLLPKERDKLYALLEDTKAGRIIFLSGDRHRAAFYRMRRPGKTSIFEVTSSSLNQSFRDPKEKGPYQLWKMIGHNNFGMIEIDWSTRILTLSLRGEDGIAARVLALRILKQD